MSNHFLPSFIMAVVILLYALPEAPIYSIFGFTLPRSNRFKNYLDLAMCLEVNHVSNERTAN